MRRLFAIAVIAIISVLTLLPVVVAQHPGSSLPACCRAKGVHHCSLTNASGVHGAGFQSNGGTCPLYQQLPASVLPLILALLVAYTVFFGLAAANRVIHLRRTFFFTPLFGMAVPKRGPPVCFA